MERGSKFIALSEHAAISKFPWREYIGYPQSSLQIDSQALKDILIMGRIVKKKAKFNSDLLLTPVSKISGF